MRAAHPLYLQSQTLHSAITRYLDTRRAGIAKDSLGELREIRDELKSPLSTNKERELSSRLSAIERKVSKLGLHLTPTNNREHRQDGVRTKPRTVFAALRDEDLLRAVSRHSVTVPDLAVIELAARHSQRPDPFAASISHLIQNDPLRLSSIEGLNVYLSALPTFADPSQLITALLVKGQCDVRIVPMIWKLVSQYPDLIQRQHIPLVRHVVSLYPQLRGLPDVLAKKNPALRDDLENPTFLYRDYFVRTLLDSTVSGRTITGPQWGVLGGLRPQRLIVRLYQPGSGLQGKALLDEVQQLTQKGHTPRTYNEAKAAIFSTIDNVVIDGIAGVFSVYSDVFVPGKSNSGSKYGERGDQNGDGFIDTGMNIEHLWPQSFFGERLPMRSDVHHLLPTFIHPNSERGRLPFGYVDDGDVVYKTNAGAKRSQHAFEPPDSVKGQVARALFYFFTRYHDSKILPSGYTASFWNRSLATLLEWHERFPPNAWERERNNRIEAFQGNRNPYVDDPQLAQRVGVEGFRF